MREHLPEKFRNNLPGLYCRQYASKVKLELGETVMYPIEALLEAKKDGQVFKRTDTHMSGYGDAAVVKSILGAFGHLHQPKNHMYAVERSIRGELSIMADTQPPFPADTFLYPKRRSTIAWNNIEELPGNTYNLTIVRNQYSKSRERLLAIGDSFLQGCLQALSTFYRDILYVRQANFQPELLDLFGPDAVVTANVERYLRSVAHDSTARSAAFGSYGLPNYNPHPAFVEAFQAQLGKVHYPSSYREWAKSVDALVFDGLGFGSLNRELRIVPGKPTWLESTGSDPQILFPRANLEKGQHYHLRVVIDSSVACKAQLFVGQVANQPSFSEEHSQSAAVSAGKNTLDFPVLPQGRGQMLRFDPLNAPGQFCIESMDLKAS